MLLLALAALATQDVAVPTPNLGDRPPTVRRFQARPGEPMVSLDDDRCAALLRRVSPGSMPEPLGRTGEARVRMYLLLDRRVAGCQAPIVVNSRLPDADRAIGRNLARPGPRAP